MSNLNLNQSLAKIIDDLDFERAFKRVKYDARYDFLRLPVEISIFEAHYQENIKHLKESIEQGSYEVLKRNFLLLNNRSCSVLG